MQLTSLALWVFVLGGGIAGWLVGGVVPDELRAPHLHLQDFALARPAGAPVEVTETTWTFLPLLFGDFDLQLDVELAAGTDLDVLVRQVEPRLVDEQLLPFHGRFVVLRLTTGTDGPGWLSREDAVLGPRQRGASVAPGLPATVWIEARGRRLTANVAGKPQGEFVADDTYGMCTLITRGGKAVVHSLTLKARGQHAAWVGWRWAWAALGALGALAIGLTAQRRGFLAPWLLTGAAVPGLLAWLASNRADLDLAWPPAWALAAMLAGCLLAAAARLARGAWVLLPVALAALLLALGDRPLRHAAPAMDAVFGPDAGRQIAEAHAQYVRRADGGLLSVQEPGRRVFLLGGQLLYDRALSEAIDASGNGHLELLLRGPLRAACKQPVVVACTPTLDGTVAQQWRLFTSCYTGYRPSVVVLGVARSELALDDRGRPRSTPGEVRGTIAAARAWCAQNGCELVVFGDTGLSDDLRRVLRDVADAGATVVQAVDGAAPRDIAAQLAAVIAPLLTR